METRHELIRKTMIVQNVNAENHNHIYASEKGCPGRTTVWNNSETHGCEMGTNARVFQHGNRRMMGKLFKHKIFNEQVLEQQEEYINETLARTTGEFEQLVQGVPWLVRKGKEILEEAIKIEQCEKEFVEIHAPRLAVGHDSKGNLLNVETDGIESKNLGLDLHTFTEVVMSYGVVNAINVDWGGSVTIVWKKQVYTS